MSHILEKQLEVIYEVTTTLHYQSFPHFWPLAISGAHKQIGHRAALRTAPGILAGRVKYFTMYLKVFCSKSYV